MQVHPLRRPLPAINWPLALLATFNLALSLMAIVYFDPHDWGVLAYAAEHAGEPILYAERGPLGTRTFMWSPLAAHALTAVVPLGLLGWRLVLVAAALAMPTWPGRLLVLASWPFWTDITNGNALTLVFVAAVWALRGSNIGTFAFLGLALLIPRPLLLPAVAWIVWQRPEWRWPFLGMVAANVIGVASTGLGPEWITALFATGAGLQDIPLNLGPTQFLGYWWMIVGIPLGVGLFLRGHVGWAGLAISNYVWIYYLYFAFPQVNGLRLRDPGISR